MGHRLTTQLRSGRIGDEGVERAWEDLASSVSSSPFMRPGWFRAWTRSFGIDHVEVFSLGEEPHALVPLLSGDAIRRSPVNEHSPDFSILAPDDETRTALLERLLAEGQHNVELLKVDEETARAAAAAAASTDHRPEVEVMQRSPYLDVTSSWSDYEASLTSNFRQGVRRKRRRLKEQGELVSESLRGDARLEDLLTEGFAVESSQWKAEEGTAIASRPETETFYREVARWAASRGWLRLDFLRLDGRACAFRFDLVCDGVRYHLKGGYDSDLSKYSPGLILQHDAVRRAFEEGLTRFEFLGADEPYKLQWTQTVRERLAVRLFAPSLRGRAGWVVRAVKSRAKRVLPGDH